MSKWRLYSNAISICLETFLDILFTRMIRLESNLVLANWMEVL